jgi:subtilisin family serine protease
MDRGNGTPARYLECLQFFLAPTDRAGADPDPARAPDVVNNSWRCSTGEGCTDPEVLLAAVEALDQAGILVVGSAGNGGPGCSTIADPPAIYDPVLTVGAVDVGDEIASFSSRGPVTADGSGRLKPDVTAPGVLIRSATRGGGYGTGSGTSFSTPHVSGLAALLLSAEPCLAGDPAALAARILADAVPLTAGQTCGAFPGGQVPNPVYGYGSARAVPGGGCGLFADGFESGDLAAWSGAVP